MRSLLPFEMYPLDDFITFTCVFPGRFDGYSVYRTPAHAFRRHWFHLVLVVEITKSLVLWFEPHPNLNLILIETHFSSGSLRKLVNVLILTVDLCSVVIHYRFTEYGRNVNKIAFVRPLLTRTPAKDPQFRMSRAHQRTFERVLNLGSRLYSISQYFGFSSVAILQFITAVRAFRSLDPLQFWSISSLFTITSFFNAWIMSSHSFLIFQIAAYACLVCLLRILDAIERLDSIRLTDLRRHLPNSHLHALSHRHAALTGLRHSHAYLKHRQVQAHSAHSNHTRQHLYQQTHLPMHLAGKVSKRNFIIQFNQLVRQMNLVQRTLDEVYAYCFLGSCVVNALLPYSVYFDENPLFARLSLACIYIASLFLTIVPTCVINTQIDQQVRTQAF